MDHRLLQSLGFWMFLFSVDRELAAAARQGGCPCGGRLHRADYLRKPRGGANGLSRELCYRLSFCCGREGCRKRLTPPSVRFLGRKVYLHAVVILVAAMRQGPTPRRVRELAELFDVDRRTMERWQLFWREQFPQTSFWKVARGQLALLGELLDLPRALLAAFFRDEASASQEQWKELLVFLSPITITGGLKSEVSR
jgi:hypothetical protein